MLRLVGVCAAALVLAACSSTDGPAVKAPEASVLELLSDDGACEVIRDRSVEKAFGVKVKNKRGWKHGRVEAALTYECDYDVPMLSTDLLTTHQEDSDQEVLDRAFTDMTKEWRPVGEYEEVPDLGTSARFGRDATLGEYVNQWMLCVLFNVDGERLRLNLTVAGSVKLDQLRPLAKEVLANLTG